MRTKWPDDDDRDGCYFFSRKLEFDTNVIFRVHALFFSQRISYFPHSIFLGNFFFSWVLLLSPRMHTQHSHCVGANGRWDITLGWAAFRASTLVGFPFSCFGLHALVDYFLFGFPLNTRCLMECPGLR